MKADYKNWMPKGMIVLHRAFSYNGKRQMSKQIIEGVADYIDIPDGGKGLDIGCGSGALTIACAKRNPKAKMIGIDRWGIEYSSFSADLCERNAKAEGVENVTFINGDATRLLFDDETFDAVTSNYVYHNIPSRDRIYKILKRDKYLRIRDIMKLRQNTLSCSL